MNINLGHSKEWHANRLTGIGGSDAKRVMEGDWLKLWEEKTGKADADDLSDVLPVQMGSFTEPLNLYWFEKQTGFPVSTENREQRHPKHEFMRCEIDGWSEQPIEAKHVNQNTSDEKVVSNYYPQIQHQLAITGASWVYLSVLFGNVRWAFFEIQRDEEYIAKLIEREEDFWDHVERDIEPANPEAEVVNISLDNMREVDLTGNNEWATHAADWLQTVEAKATFDGAAKGIKSLIEPDVKLATGHGVIAKRSKAGAITIRKEK